MELKFMRLITGEDVIANVKSDNGKVYTLLHPMKLGYMTGNSLKQGIIMYPWIYPVVSNNDSYDMSWTNILTMSNPSERIRSLYEKSVEYYYYSNEGPSEQEVTVEEFFTNIEEEIAKNTEESSNTAASMLETFLNQNKKRNGLN